MAAVMGFSDHSTLTFSFRSISAESEAGGSIATIAAALVAPHSARADGFQGTPTVASGLVSFDRTPATSETVTIRIAEIAGFTIG